MLTLTLILTFLILAGTAAPFHSELQKVSIHNEIKFSWNSSQNGNCFGPLNSSGPKAGSHTIEGLCTYCPKCGTILWVQCSVLLHHQQKSQQCLIVHRLWRNTWHLLKMVNFLNTQGHKTISPVGLFELFSKGANYSWEAKPTILPIRSSDHWFLVLHYCAFLTFRFQI